MINPYAEIIKIKKRIYKKPILSGFIANSIDNFFNKVISSIELTKDNIVRARDLSRDNIVIARDLSRDNIIRARDLSRDNIFDLEIKTTKKEKLLKIYRHLESFIFFIYTFSNIIFFTIVNKKYEINKKTEKEAVDNIDNIITNSKNISKKINHIYNRKSVIIKPPIVFNKYLNNNHKNYWLSVNRIVPEKRIEMQIEAFKKMPEEKLVIIGSSDNNNKNYSKTLNEIKTDNVIFIGQVNEKDLLRFYSECKGHITTSKNEDFGMTAIEAMASGKPVIAPNEGGYKESIIEDQTGILIDNINEYKITEAVKKINETLNKNPEFYINNCKKQAEKYDIKIFAKKILNSID